MAQCDCNCSDGKSISVIQKSRGHVALAGRPAHSRRRVQTSLPEWRTYRGGNDKANVKWQT